MLCRCHHVRTSAYKGDVLNVSTGLGRNPVLLGREILSGKSVGVTFCSPLGLKQPSRRRLSLLFTTLSRRLGAKNRNIMS